MTVSAPLFNLLHVRFDECIVANDTSANLARVLRNITEDGSSKCAFNKLIGSESAERLYVEIRKLYHFKAYEDYLTWDDFRLQLTEKTLLDLPISSSEPVLQQSYPIPSPRYKEEQRNYHEFLKNYDGNGELLNIVKNSPHNFGSSSSSSSDQLKLLSPPIMWESRLRDPLIHERIDQMMSEKSDDVADTRMRTMSEDDADELNDAASNSAALLEALLQARYAPLSPEETKSVNDVLRRPENNTDARPIKFDIPIINSTIVRLRPGVWLNDEIVNFYMSMLQERDKELVSIYPKRVPSYYFNSYFIAKLLDEGGYKYANVKRWSSKAKINIFELNKIFFPVNIANNHWTMAIINMKKKQICYYDSFHAKGERYLNGLLNYIVDEGMTKYNMTVDRSEWSFISGDSSSPRQTNGCDCGVFSIMCADFLTDDLPLSYHQSDMNAFRNKICADILRGSLAYPTH